MAGFNMCSCFFDIHLFEWLPQTHTHALKNSGIFGRGMLLPLFVISMQGLNIGYPGFVEAKTFGGRYLSLVMCLKYIYTLKKMDVLLFMTDLTHKNITHTYQCADVDRSGGTLFQE
jgi:hypothetical protein